MKDYTLHYSTNLSRLLNRLQMPLSAFFAIHTSYDIRRPNLHLFEIPTIKNCLNHFKRQKATS